MDTTTNTSTNAAPTNAPFTVESHPDESNALIYGRGRKKGQRKQLVAQVWSGDDRSLDVAIANATLMSASHEMLSALIAAVSAAQPLPAPLGPPLKAHVDVWPQWVINARAAIAKATTIKTE